MEVALLDLFSTVATLMDSLPFDIACQYSLLVWMAARASASEIAAFPVSYTHLTLPTTPYV